MAQTAAHLVDHLVDHVIPHVPVRQWVLSLPITLRLLLAAQPKLVTPVLQVVHRVITRFLLGQAGLKADEADSGAVTLIQRFGSAAKLNIQGGVILFQEQAIGMRTNGGSRRSMCAPCLPAAWTPVPTGASSNSGWWQRAANP